MRFLGISVLHWTNTRLCTHLQIWIDFIADQSFKLMPWWHHTPKRARGYGQWTWTHEIISDSPFSLLCHATFTSFAFPNLQSTYSQHWLLQDILQSTALVEKETFLKSLSLGFSGTRQFAFSHLALTLYLFRNTAVTWYKTMGFRVG